MLVDRTSSFRRMEATRELAVSLRFQGGLGVYELNAHHGSPLRGFRNTPVIPQFSVGK